MVIYTKKGDGGTTSLYDKSSVQRTRISKSSLIVGALGAVDELDSYLGVCASFCENPKTYELIQRVQKNLLRIGAIIAGSGLKFARSETSKLEKIIDELEGKLPVLKNFVVPGGSKISAHLHYARALARRAERRVVALSKDRPAGGKKLSPHILSYLNRLSDFLFMLARKTNRDAGMGDEVWVGKKKR
ncbi:ATP:cob(I)alamin adenosyltransferase [Candidatus Woesebacteria bacterium GWB1_43_5]|uniref:Corrinoid adenosyltransferase n=1 Tax=Candidatus Woesebacteria bacterium GWB1_43_5 TaxID=1802474 RepID=A0A1F7WTA5_9BACT|nr:MAG: ATP:cob(I)alamin adenosyltransferase [Candidatus Woesebacteria bacterium GWB1_43_5]